MHMVNITHPSQVQALKKFSRESLSVRIFHWSRTMCIMEYPSHSDTWTWNGVGNVTPWKIKMIDVPTYWSWHVCVKEWMVKLLWKYNSVVPQFLMYLKLGLVWSEDTVLRKWMSHENNDSIKTVSKSTYPPYPNPTYWAAHLTNAVGCTQRVHLGLIQLNYEGLNGSKWWVLRYITLVSIYSYTIIASLWYRRTFLSLEDPSSRSRL